MGRHGAITRRRVVTAGSAAAFGAALAVTGCRSALAPRRVAPEPGSDVALAGHTLQLEITLLDYLDGLIRQHPGLSKYIAPLVAAQRMQVSALRDTFTTPPAIAHRRAHVAGDRRIALRQLEASLRRARDDRRADALVASSGLLARLLASIAAGHAASLEQLAALGVR